MLDIALRRVAFGRRGSEFRIDDLSAVFPRNTITALVGAAGSGKSTILRLISGHHKARSGSISIGARDATDLKPARRPVFSSWSDAMPPARWSVQHALIAALRERKLDLEDRRREFELAVEKWRLGPIVTSTFGALSDGERLRARFAQIEILRPAVFLADRFLADASPADLPDLIREIGSSLRMIGSTVVTEPASLDEISMCDRALVIDQGRVVQSGAPNEIYARPESEAAARALGEVNAIPLVIRGTTVESLIGSWEVNPPPFQGDGVALARPGDFSLAAVGHDSDFIFSIEQASFRRGEWLLRGFLTGAHLLTVVLPASVEIHKGKLLPLRYDPARWSLLPRAHAGLEGPPTDSIPPLRDSR